MKGKEGNTHEATGGQKDRGTAKINAEDGRRVFTELHYTILCPQNI